MSLKDELRALKLQYVELEQKYKVIKKAAKGSKATEKNSSKSKLAETDEVIGLYARRFGVMNELYVAHNAFLQPQPVGVRADNSTRWQTEESALEGLIAELYEELPIRLHGMLANTSHFRDRVRSLQFLYYYLTPLVVSIGSQQQSTSNNIPAPNTNSRTNL